MLAYSQVTMPLSNGARAHTSPLQLDTSQAEQISVEHVAKATPSEGKSSSESSSLAVSLRTHDSMGHDSMGNWHLWLACTYVQRGVVGGDAL